MELPPKRVEEFLYQRIPLAKAINCQVIESSNKHITLLVPKFANTVRDDDFSDLCAVTLCKLAAWTFLQVALQRLDYSPLLSLDKASWSKKREIDSNAESVTATCQLPKDKEWQQFLRMLSRKARATAYMNATISDELGETATLSCQYSARDLDPT